MNSDQAREINERLCDLPQEEAVEAIFRTLGNAETLLERNPKAPLGAFFDLLEANMDSTP